MIINIVIKNKGSKKIYSVHLILSPPPSGGPPSIIDRINYYYKLFKVKVIYIILNQ